MNIAIMGCGPGGSYLYCLLRQRKPEVKVELFDIVPDTMCGTKSCCWAVNFSIFTNLCHAVGLETMKYLMMFYDQIIVEDLKIRANLAVINKPLLIKGLLDGAEIHTPPIPVGKDYDRIIDATGSRAYLGYEREDRKYSAVETRVVFQTESPPMVFIHNTGYSWVASLGNGTAHLGSLSVLDRQEADKEIEKTRVKVNAGSVICTCDAPIWAAGPALPFVKGNVWGLGESIGLVSPVVGTGITPAMDSARIMVKHFDDPKGYEKEVLKRYGYMKNGLSIAKRLWQSKKPKVLDIIPLWKMCSLSGVCPSITEIIKGLVKSGAGRGS